MTTAPTPDVIRAVVRDELARHRDDLVAALRSSTHVPEPQIRSTPGEFPRCPIDGCRHLAVSGHCLTHGDVYV